MARPLWDDVVELERRLRAVEPAVRVVAERHVRRVLRHLRDAGDDRADNAGLPVRVSADFLRTAGLLDVELPGGSAADVVLISAPDDRGLADLPDGTVLRHYWRLLFRAAVQHDISTRLTAAEADRRLATLLPDVVGEIRFVLETDHVVRRPAPATELLPAFAATYAELLAFEPDRIGDVYPSAPPSEELTTALGLAPDLIASADRYRPAGATEHSPLPTALSVPELLPVSEAEESDGPARLGNYTRAAIRRACRIGRTSR